MEAYGDLLVIRGTAFFALVVLFGTLHVWLATGTCSWGGGRVIQSEPPEGRWFDPQLPQSTCLSDQNAEPKKPIPISIWKGSWKRQIPVQYFCEQFT